MDADSLTIIRQQEYYAELGRATEKGLTEIMNTIDCRGVYRSFSCNMVAAKTAGCALQYFCQIRNREAKEGQQ